MVLIESVDGIRVDLAKAEFRSTLVKFRNISSLFQRCRAGQARRKVRRVRRCINSKLFKDLIRFFHASNDKFRPSSVAVTFHMQRHVDVMISLSR